MEKDAHVFSLREDALIENILQQFLETMVLLHSITDVVQWGDIDILNRPCHLRGSSVIPASSVV